MSGYRRGFAITLLALAAGPAAAQWPIYGGGALAEGATATAIDDRGNVYIAGEFRGAATFGPETLHSQGLSDIFVAKYKPDGELVWARTAGGPSIDRPNAIAVDASENVYVTGYFAGSIRFFNDPVSGFGTHELPAAVRICDGPCGGNNNGPGNQYREDPASPDRKDMFVAKLEPAGSWAWARQVGGPGHDEGFGIALIPGVEDPNNPVPDGVVVAGRSGCPYFWRQDGSERTLAASASCGQSSVLVARLDTQGNWVWGILGGRSDRREWATDLAIDPGGRVYLSGLFFGSTTIGSTNLSFTGTAPGGSLELWHRWQLDQGWDGGVVEYSSDNGLNWYDILAGDADNDPSSTAGNPLRWVEGGYNGKLNSGENNPLNSRCTTASPNNCAWTHNQASFGRTRVDLTDFAGLSMRFRWRFGSGTAVGGTGWWVDDVEIRDNSGNVLFTDNMESGGSKWSQAAPLGGTQWAQTTTSSNSPSHSWFLPNEAVRRDHSLQMVQSVPIPEGVPNRFIAKLTSTETNNPTWQWVQRIHDNVTLGDMAVDADQNLFFAGTSSGAATLGGVSLTTTGAFVAKLRDLGGTVAWQWARGATGGRGEALALYPGGDVLLAGHFSGAASFTNVQIDPQQPGQGSGTRNLTSAPAASVFAARLNNAGTGWRWLAHSSSAAGDDRALGVVTDGDEQAYVTGDFRGPVTFGTRTISAIGQSDAFVANLDARTGEWFEVQFDNWTVGEEVVPPGPHDELCLDDDVVSVPEIVIGSPGQPIPNYFFWTPPSVSDNGKGRLYAVQPTTATIRWKRTCDPLDLNRRLSVGASDWPRDAGGGVRYCGSQAHQEALALDPAAACAQLHISTAPVEIEPVAAGMAYGAQVQMFVADRSADAAVTVAGPNQVKFTATDPGFSVLIYSTDPNNRDTSANPVKFEVVETLSYDTSLQIVPGGGGPAQPVFTNGAACSIGTKLVGLPFGHDDYGGRNGHVIFDRALYDPAAYDRVTRLGPILPVNKVPVGSDGLDLMAVAWYRKNHHAVAWPVRSVRYDCQWPANPDKIIIASELGSEVLGQPPLDPQIFQSAQIYAQNDRASAGFNPNDEHAFFAPANSESGFDALFALRNDFSSSERTKSSEPYVLLKYLSGGEWTMKVYQVLATGAGYNSFQYSGTAGTPVNPPYPVRLLGNCAETSVTGKPAFKDVKDQVWAKAAGIMAAEYWYPLQPGFWYDRDANGVAERTTGDCTAWLGGANDDPVDVRYDIAWPPNPPVLLVGETLLRPKRGLPNIMDQAAVEIVFDEVQDRLLEQAIYDPTRSLARIIDPFTPRSVAIDGIPDEIATRIDPTTGFHIPIGNAAGTQRLPQHLQDRVYFNFLDKRLAFGGDFDAAGAGEPLLLLNVMSDAERKRLKRLDGGDGTEEASSTKPCVSLDEACTWDQAIEALYRLSRNPERLDLAAPSTCTVDHVEVVFAFFTLQFPFVTCTSDGDGDADNGLLIGYKDDVTITLDSQGRQVVTAGRDGIPENLGVAGFQPGLTAGFAQGTGYLTLAFNNDPSLGALPVSLNVIRVDCLEIPGENPGDPPRQSTYQGQIQLLESENVFDESITLRHSGDFGGEPSAMEFEWFMHPDEGGDPPFPLPDPENGQMHGWLQFTGGGSPVGAMDINIEGANIQTLSDNWFVVRYRYIDPPTDAGPDGVPGTADDGPLCGGDWSIYAGQPGATPLAPRAQLAEGWIKRVVRGLNPFEARVTDFHASETNTYASMLVQIGQRYEGDIAFNADADNLNNIGLIEAYTTVLNRGKKLSVDGTPPVNYAPANQALLLVASRIADFYTVLGNEAYADAQDPMIGFGTGSGVYGTLAPTIFAFQNQLDSLLEEELVLLRGRDDGQGPVAASPVYNRLFWNFTSGDGEFAYALGYNLTDQNVDGVIDEQDARILFPQGHGDAWGHYLTGLKTYYDLLRHPFYTWLPRAEAVIVAGTPIQVDFLDERKFAKIAAAKARVGAEVVDLTYRRRYVEDPSGQWQGYKDTHPSRAWGLSEWGRRAGQGAYFDWVVGNAILPTEDPNPDHVGIEQVDRSTVEELADVVAQFVVVQEQLDKADRGLNPLGLAKGVVPFDIDPTLIDPPSGGATRKTHFEQIYDRAMAAMDNAVATFNHANLLSEMLRRNQDSVDDIYTNTAERERDYKNRLIEIFGYPYSADIGPGGTYPTGYDGPDVYHYMYVDASDLTGGVGAERQVFTAYFRPLPTGIGFFNFDVRDPDCSSPQNFDNCSLAPAPTVDQVLAVQYTVATHTRGDRAAGGTDTADSFFLVKPADWEGSNRRSPGELQDRLSDLLVAMNNYEQILAEYNELVTQIQGGARSLEMAYNVRGEKVKIINRARQEESNLEIAIGVMKGAQVALKRGAEIARFQFKDTAECLPEVTIVGLAAGGDLTSAIRCSIKTAGNIVGFALDTAADVLNIAEIGMDTAKSDVGRQKDIEIELLEGDFELFKQGKELEKLMREEVVKRLEAYQRREIVEQQRGNYLAALSKGQRLLAELAQFRRGTAGDIQVHRYRDMAFRIFRNDALQKYRAQFDLTARYAYLAATAYDYETNLLGGHNAGGRKFLTNIVRERSLGQLINGTPVPGSRGLAGPLGQMDANFQVLKGQLGFNNPQTETNRFSLRREAFRINPEEESDVDWRDLLEGFRQDNLWDLPEFRRFCRPFAPENPNDPQPGLVIPFETTVTFGLNFFGWPLGPGDSAYDPTNFATKVRSVGVWFTDYAGLPLSNTPRVYLVPVGADVLRSPFGDPFATREWAVVDQVLPVPFPIGASDLQDPEWIPVNDTLSGSFGTVRRFSSFRAYDDPGAFNPAQTTSDSRLIGRSVWNRQWLLIIPGGTFLTDPTEGLETFIHGRLIPGGNGERDGEGVKDIKLFFQTYAYSGG